MEAAQRAGRRLRGVAGGRLHLARFLPAYDAAATLVHLLDLLARSGAQLSSVVAGLPGPHIAHETVVTPWERKGAVMREMVERAKDRDRARRRREDHVRRRLGAGAARPRGAGHARLGRGRSDTDADGSLRSTCRRIRQMLR